MQYFNSIKGLLKTKRKYPFVSAQESTIRISALLGSILVLFLAFAVSPMIPELAREEPAISWFFGLLFPLAIVSFIVAPQVISRELNLDEAQSPSPFLIDIVEETSKVLELKRKPRIYVIESRIPKCLTFGRTNNSAKIIVSTGLLNILTEKELRNCISHELSHIKNRDVFFVTWAIAFSKALIFWTISFIAYLLLNMIYGSVTAEVTLNWTRGIIFFTPFLVFLPWMIIKSICRIRESLADAYTSMVLGDDKSLIASIKKVGAWKKLWSSFDSLSTSRYTRVLNKLIDKLPHRLVKVTIAPHPSIKDRIRDLEIGKYITRGDNPFPSSLESAFYNGLLALYILYGAIFFGLTVGVALHVPGDTAIEVIGMAGMVASFAFIILSNINPIMNLSFPKFRKRYKNPPRFILKDTISRIYFSCFTFLFLPALASVFMGTYREALLTITVLPVALILISLMFIYVIWRLP